MHEEEQRAKGSCSESLGGRGRWKDKGQPQAEPMFSWSVQTGRTLVWGGRESTSEGGRTVQAKACSFSSPPFRDASFLLPRPPPTLLAPPKVRERMDPQHGLSLQGSIHTADDISFVGKMPVIRGRSQGSCGVEMSLPLCVGIDGGGWSLGASEPRCAVLGRCRDAEAGEGLATADRGKRTVLGEEG